MSRNDLLDELRTSLNRRQCLQVGMLGAVGLGLPELQASRATAGGRDGDKSCIFIMLSGGPSHIDTFDPKPDAPADIRGAYRAISSRVPGVRLGEKLPRMAGLADRFCLVRTLCHKAGDHIEAAHVCLSGQSDGRRSNTTPYFGSIMAKVKPSRPGVPSYVWLHNLLVGTKKEGRHESGGILGPAYAPFRIGRDLDTPAAPGFRVKAFDAPEGLTTRHVRERCELLDRLEPASSRWRQSTAGADLQRLQERALDLITSPEARRAFDIHREPAQVRDRYGRHPLGQYLLLARRQIEAGVRLVSVVGCPGMPIGATEPPIRQLWDMHDTYFEGNDNMYGTGPYGLGLALPRLDQAFSALMEDLEQRGLLEAHARRAGGRVRPNPEVRGRGPRPGSLAVLLFRAAGRCRHPPRRGLRQLGQNRSLHQVRTADRTGDIRGYHLPYPRCAGGASAGPEKPYLPCIGRATASGHLRLTLALAFGEVRIIGANGEPACPTCQQHPFAAHSPTPP